MSFQRNISTFFGPARRLIAVGILSLVCVVSVMAQESYDFLNLTSSARIYGLGGINITTVEDNPSTADQNPALLGPEMNGWLDVNYMRYIAGSNFAGAKYAGAIGEHGAWLAGMQYMGYGNIPETDVEGNVIGDFAPKDIIINGMFSYDVRENLRIGATVKMIYSSYAEYSAFALATDLGINYYNPDSDLSLSLVGANLGGQLKKFENVSESLPMDLRMGVTYGLKSIPLRLSLTLWNLTRWKDNYKGFMRHVVIGVDFVPSQKFYLSLGYNYNVRKAMQSYQRNFLSGFSLGGGFNSSKFNIGLALAQPHSGATTFMVNFGLKINDLIH